MIFRLGGAGGVLDEDVAIHAAALVASVPVAFGVVVALDGVGVSTAVAANLALVGVGSVVAEPSAVSGVGARVDVGVGLAGRAADVVNGVPDAITSGVGLVVAVGGGGVGVASGAAFARALEFEDEVAEQVAVGHVLSVEGQDGAGADRVASSACSRKAVGERRPVKNIA